MKTDLQVNAEQMIESVWAVDGIRVALDRLIRTIDNDDDSYISLLTSALKVIVSQQTDIAESLARHAEASGGAA